MRDAERWKLCDELVTEAVTALADARSVVPMSVPHAELLASLNAARQRLEMLSAAVGCVAKCQALAVRKGRFDDALGRCRSDLTSPLE